MSIKKSVSVLLTAALLISLMGGCQLSAVGELLAEAVMDTDGEVVFEEGTVSLSGQGLGLDEDSGDVLIQAAGVYKISGTAEDGRLKIEAGADDDVTLLMDGLSLGNSEEEAIYAKSAKSLTLIVSEGSENSISSGVETEMQDNAADEESSGAALRAKCDLTISGSGTLRVYGYINNGIKADGDLSLESVALSVTAANDGIKSESSVLISSGSFDIAAMHDAVQAGNELIITGGDFNIFTGEGSGSADMKTSDSAMMGNPGLPSSNPIASGEASGENSGEAENTEDGAAAVSDETTTESSNEMTFGSFEMPDPSALEMLEMPGFGSFEMDWDADDDGTSDSAKGLKATGDITISGGSFVLDCEDDAVHSDGSVTISDGEFDIRSGDDGIHGDASLTIIGGDIDISYCYEGLEANVILIDDGLISIVAVDDGMNVNGGNAGFGMMPGGGGSREASGETSGEASEEMSEAETGTEEADEELSEPLLSIRGGVITVDSGGDGLDSNGSLYIMGGTVKVSGPSTDWDAAIDTGDGGAYEFVISGGTVMTAGYSSMAETPEDSDDAQCSIYYCFDDTAEDGATATLYDSTGNVVLETAFVHGYNCVILSSPDLQVGEIYTLCVGDASYEIEMTETSMSNRMGMGGFGGMGGGPGGRH